MDTTFFEKLAEIKMKGYSNLSSVQIERYEELTLLEIMKGNYSKGIGFKYRGNYFLFTSKGYYLEITWPV